MTYAVQVASTPFAKKHDGTEGRVYLERVDVEDIGVVIGGPDKQGDVLVLFDTRVERVNPVCLDEYDSPIRVQMWQDMLWLEVGDQYEAVETYWKHLRHIKRLRETSGKTCSSCGETKALEEFGVDATRRDGLEPRCRECRSEQAAARQRAFE